MGISADTVISPSMIVHELDVIGVPVAPHEANAPLLIDADRMLAAPFTRQRLEPVARRNAQVVEPRDRFKQEQLRQVQITASAHSIPICLSHRLKLSTYTTRSDRYGCLRTMS